MKKLLLFGLCLLLIGSVAAISFYGDADFKGLYKIYNVTNISATKFLYNNGTELVSGTGSGAAGWYGNATTNLNMSNYNVTSVTCIYFVSGGSICTA